MCFKNNLYLSERYIPLQYIFRAAEAKKILSVQQHTTIQAASRIAIAEAVQLAFFAIQTVFYSLAFFGTLSPTVAGIVVSSLLPVAAFASYHTYVHYKKFSRVILTCASIFTLAICSAIAIYGIVTDSALSLCGGGIALHLFRNLSEYMDAQNVRKNEAYCREILGEELSESLISTKKK